MWNLEQDPGSVAGAGIAALGPPMIEVLEDLEPFPDNVVGFLALDVGHEADPATVFLEPGIVEPLWGGESGNFHVGLSAA
jgi:hypothetical protein